MMYSELITEIGQETTGTLEIIQTYTYVLMHQWTYITNYLVLNIYISMIVCNGMESVLKSLEIHLRKLKMYKFYGILEIFLF